MPKLKKSQTSKAASGAPKYTFVLKGKHWYFRHKLLGVSALPGQPGTAAFHTAYADKLTELSRRLGTHKEAEQRRKDEAHTKSVRTFCESYLASTEFSLLKPLTKRDYERVIGILIAGAGDLQFPDLTRSDVVSIRDGLYESRGLRTANYAVQLLSLIGTWAVDHEMLPENHLLGVKKLKGQKGGGYRPWTEAEIAHFIANARPHILLGVLIGLHTGQRMGDCIAMTPYQFLGGRAVMVRQQKTDELLEIPLAGQLRAAYEHRSHPNAERVIVNPDGQPYNESAFSTALAKELKRVGLQGISFHGLRYAAAARLEELGCTVGMITSIIGHRTFQMAMQYATKRRDAAAAGVRIKAKYG